MKIKPKITPDVFSVKCSETSMMTPVFAQAHKTPNRPNVITINSVVDEAEKYVFNSVAINPIVIPIMMIGISPEILTNFGKHADITICSAGIATSNMPI